MGKPIEELIIMTPIPRNKPSPYFSDFITRIQEDPRITKLCLTTLFEGCNIDQFHASSFPGKEKVDSIKSLARIFDPDISMLEYWDRTDDINTVVSVWLQAFGSGGEDDYIGSWLIECCRFTR